MICNTIKHLIDELKKSLPIIQDLIKKRMILKKDYSAVLTVSGLCDTNGLKASALQKKCKSGRVMSPFLS